MRVHFTPMMDRGGYGHKGNRPKGQGQSIIVSDFIDEHGGYLVLSDQEHKKAHYNHSGPVFS